LSRRLRRFPAAVSIAGRSTIRISRVELVMSRCVASALMVRETVSRVDPIIWAII